MCVRYWYSESDVLFPCVVYSPLACCSPLFLFPSHLVLFIGPFFKTFKHALI
ncbi:hypothetical protein Hanom_Chr16g01516011 [Helianthus anomalus]